MADKKDSLTHAREKIRERIAVAEEAKKVELLRQRIALASKGASALDEKNMVNAVMAFKGYIKILEDMKGVPNGGLAPAHFDAKADVAEMMLVSGIFWDLVKLYDRTRTPEKYAEFKTYLSKYIQFSKGMPYQAMSAETLRKYIQSKNALHKKDFSEAYKVIQLSKCFVATELVEYTHVETIPALRKFRDRVLKEYPLGRKFVAWYYRKGPGLAERIGKLPSPGKQLAGKSLDLLASFLRIT